MMKQASWQGNLLAVAGLLAAALAAAVGCPAGSSRSSGQADRAAEAQPESQAPAPRPTNGAVRDQAAPHPSSPENSPQTTVEQPPPAGGSAPTDDQTLAAAAPPRESATPPADPSPPQERSQEPLFENWPKPKFVLFITGRQSGYIEPCGCAGLTNQKGGLARRHTLYKQLKAKGWEVVPLDVGNQVKRYGRQAEIKFQITAEGLKELDYQAVALGPDDLRLSSGELFAVLADSPQRQSPFLCANANLFGLTKSHRVVEAGGQRIGVAAVLGSEQLKKLQSAEIEKSSPEEALRKVTPQLEGAGVDLQVLLAHTDYDEARSLAQKFPQFQVVIAAAGSGEPPGAPEKIGQNLLILAGEKSMHVGVLGVFDDPQTPFRYQRVSLDARLEDSPYMLKLLATYQDTLQEAGLEGLGLRPVPHPSGNEFVGSARCGECHTQAFAVWETTPHHLATESLVHPGERIHIPRHFDPECLSCHVTGWSPQEYFPYRSGYVGLEQSEHLHGNGCENCHGPGSRHVAAESGELDLDEAAIEKLRDTMRLPLAKARETCLTCHDLDNDPHFATHEEAFEEYWERIKHYGKD